MRVWRLVFNEIIHRKLNFGLGLISVTLAVGCLVGALTLLDGHDRRTDQIITRKTAETEARMKKLEDDYRKITKGLGFNILILPKDQNLGDLYAEDYATKYMPESYATTLSNSRIVTINHLLPSLQQKIKWPEQERTIILVGTRGEVPLMHRDPKKPLLAAVPTGTMVVGYELHRSLKLSIGDKLKLMGRELTVKKLHEERGTKDDITIWIDLKEAQELLDKKGLVNGILALECYCAGDRMAKIRNEISAILPETQVIEFATKAIARAEARDKAAIVARESLESEKKNRIRHRSEIEGFASVLVPVVILGCAAWVAILTFTNVRDRRAEIGILRAIGVRSNHILSIFLAKAALMGLWGALIGYAAGYVVGGSVGETGQASLGVELFNPAAFGLVLICAPLLSGIASWLPAMAAAQQDPAVVLREE